MFRLFIIIVQLILLIIITLFVINYSFNISIEISDYIFSISSAYAFIFLILFLLIFFIFQTIYFRTKFRYLKYKIIKKFNTKERGYNAFVSGMISIANKDYKKAVKETKKMSTYLKDDQSLTLLLKSEIFKIEKKYPALEKVYKEMSKSKLTENLGLRGMMEQYLRSQDYHHAYIYGEKLFNNNPHVEKIYETLVNIIAKTNNWTQLLQISDKALSSNIINKENYNINKSIAFFEISKIKKSGDVKDSLNYIQKALKLRKNFPPYVILYVELLIEEKKYSVAKKYLKKVWNENPHSEYKLIITKLAESLNIEIYNLANFITSSNKDLEESKMLMIEASILTNKWEEARREIRELINVDPKKEVCLLMAKIEEGDTGNIQAVNAWKNRAKNGVEKNIWICSISNKAQTEWSSISEGGYFNSLTWQKPIIINPLESIEN